VEYSAQRVRAKTRAAVRKREEQIEIDEMESGELNLIPYLDMVTNLMLFLLASVSAGIILTQIDTTLPDKAPPPTGPPKPPSTNPDDQPLKLFVSVKRDEMILWSATGLEGTLREPKPGYTFKRIGQTGAECDGPYMCESNSCDVGKRHPNNPLAGTCVQSKEEQQPVYEYHRLNDALFEIANRRYAGKQRKPDTYQIVLQADGAIPYSTIVSIMSAMRCKMPKVGGELKSCALPTEDEKLKQAKEPVSPDGKLFDTTRAVYDPKTMALFSDIQFSSGFE
jgi:biopolymer transport protein ExbD